MSDFRTIETASYAKIVAPSSFGRPQKLEWIALKHLVIDPEYQREITIVGRKNIRHIVESFSWSMFTPVMVASVGGGRYAIVDGQHRVTAAALCGIEKVPCAIIDAERGEQAAAFRAINVNITRLHTVQIFHAACAAKDKTALKIADVCRRANVKIPRSVGVRAAGQTHAVKTISKAVDRFTADVVALGLRCIMHSGEGNPAELSASIIWGVIEVLHTHPEWRRAAPPPPAPSVRTVLSRRHAPSRCRHRRSQQGHVRDAALRGGAHRRARSTF